MIDRPEASMTLSCCGTANESLPVAYTDSQKLVWESSGLVKSNGNSTCPTNTGRSMAYADVEQSISSCWLSVYVILDGAIVERYENVPNTGVYSFQSPTNGP